MRLPHALVLLALVAAVARCANPTEIDDYPCPDAGTTLTYENFGEAFVDSYCNGCHGSAVTDRQGAPSSYVFDTRDQIAAARDRIFARAAADNDSMPPGPDDPPEAEREELAEWLACGAP